MGITELQNNNSIPLIKIKEIFPNFITLQMYYYLKNLPLLEYLEDNLFSVGKLVKHIFENITSDMICVH